MVVVVLSGAVATLLIDNSGHASTETQYTTVTETRTVSFNSPIPTTNPTSRFYEIIFNETGYCGPPSTYPAPWAVSLDNSTVLVQPPSAALPLQQGTIGYSPANKNYSMIIFSVPDGTYNYIVQPSSIFRQSTSVVVNGSNVIVQVQVNGEVIPCTAHT